MRVKLRPERVGTDTKVTVFVEGQNAGSLRFHDGEYEPFLLAMVGGAALLKEGECNHRVEVEVEDRRS